MTAPTTAIKITHSWCPTCQGGTHGKARCGTARGAGFWPAGAREQSCRVCADLATVLEFCERCGEPQ